MAARLREQAEAHEAHLRAISQQHTATLAAFEERLAKALERSEALLVARVGGGGSGGGRGSSGQRRSPSNSPRGAPNAPQAFASNSTSLGGVYREGAQEGSLESLSDRHGGVEGDADADADVEEPWFGATGKPRRPAPGGGAFAAMGNTADGASPSQRDSGKDRGWFADARQGSPGRRRGGRSASPGRRKGGSPPKQRSPRDAGGSASPGRSRRSSPDKHGAVQSPAHQRGATAAAEEAAAAAAVRLHSPPWRFSSAHLLTLSLSRPFFHSTYESVSLLLPRGFSPSPPTHTHRLLR